MNPTQALAAALKHCEGDLSPAGLLEGLLANGMTVARIVDESHALVRLSLDGDGDRDASLDAVIITGSRDDCVAAAFYEPKRDGYETRIVAVERDTP